MPDESSRASESANQGHAPPPPAPKLAAVPKQPWGPPLARLDAQWTALESKLCVWVLLAEIAALCFWIALKGLSSDYSAGGGDTSGLVFRGLITSVVLGMVVHKATKPKGATTETADRHAVFVTVAVVAGLFLGRVWVNVGVDYFSNLLNWLQNASLLMLVGGLRGLGTRFTLWLALLGASIATAKGKHINVDVVMRFLPVKARVPVAVLGWTAAAVMCLAGVVGFADHIAIESFKAPATQPCPGDASDANKDCDVPFGQKMGVVTHEVGNDFFLMGRQMSLDLRSIPHVLAGTKYDGWMKASEWNDWLKGGDWESHFKQEDVNNLLLPADQPDAVRSPAVNVPGGMEQARGLLIRELNFVFPFGLLMIALRFLLRSLLAISGYVRVDPDAAHEEEDVEEKHPEPAPARAKGAA
jgi:TRAP-type C4-dicarboxylate transport system permease small subunit